MITIVKKYGCIRANTEKGCKARRVVLERENLGGLKLPE